MAEIRWGWKDGEAQERGHASGAKRARYSVISPTEGDDAFRFVLWGMVPSRQLHRGWVETWGLAAHRGFPVRCRTWGERDRKKRHKLLEGER